MKRLAFGHALVRVTRARLRPQIFAELAAHGSAKGLRVRRADSDGQAKRQPDRAPKNQSCCTHELTELRAPLLPSRPAFLAEQYRVRERLSPQTRRVLQRDVHRLRPRVVHGDKSVGCDPNAGDFFRVRLVSGHCALRAREWLSQSMIAVEAPGGQGATKAHTADM